MYANSAAHDGQVMQGFVDGHIVVIGHISQEVKLCCPKEYSKKNRVKQPAKLMTLFLFVKLVRSLGIKIDVKETSKKEKFWRKEYMGVLR